MKIAVVVATYSRPRQLQRLLECLARQTVKAEVIVVDDGSTTTLDEVVRPFECTLIRQDNAGPAAARNRGVAEANADFIAFTDDDCEPAPDWLAHLLKQLEDDPALLLGGRTVNGASGNAYSELSQLIVDIAYAFYRGAFFASNNMALSKQRFLECGGFDESFRPASEDRELCDRWRHRGWPFRFVPEALVRHHHNHTFASFLRTHFNYGRGAVRFHRACGRRGSSAILPHLRFFAEFPALYLQANPRGARVNHAAAVFLLVLWQGANTAGALYELFWMLARK
jgi:GT2 family glycosyltransferase